MSVDYRHGNHQIVTMFLKLFIVMLASCSVQSSIIVAVFQEDNEGVAEYSSDCNSYCLRHLLLRSYCFGNTCKCYGGLWEDGSESSEIKASVRCNDKGCDQLCRRLGFPGGECVWDTCKCDLNDKTPTIDVPEARSTDVCSEVCHRFNYIGGLCRAGNCQCY